MVLLSCAPARWMRAMEPIDRRNASFIGASRSRGAEPITEMRPAVVLLGSSPLFSPRRALWQISCLSIDTGTERGSRPRSVSQPEVQLEHVRAQEPRRGSLVEQVDAQMELQPRDRGGRRVRGSPAAPSWRVGPEGLEPEELPELLRAGQHLAPGIGEADVQDRDRPGRCAAQAQDRALAGTIGAARAEDGHAAVGIAATARPLPARAPLARSAHDVVPD